MEAWKPNTSYFDDANQETFVAQIETPEAVENIEAIAAVRGVDRLFIGPGRPGRRLRTSAHRPSRRGRRGRAALGGTGWPGVSPQARGSDPLSQARRQIVPWGGDALMNALGAAAKAGGPAGRLVRRHHRLHQEAALWTCNHACDKRSANTSITCRPGSSTSTRLAPVAPPGLPVARRAVAGPVA
jgi:hypothetical protein